MNLQDAENLALSLMEKHGLKDWTFQFSRAKRFFGWCCSGTKTITLSAPLTRINDENRVRLTILHEVAHGIVNTSNGHKRIWKLKCLEIGGDGQRCHSGDNTVLIKGNYIATCKYCGKSYNMYRKPRTMRFCHCTRGVNDRFHPSNILQWNLNNNIAAQEQLVEMD